MADTLLLGRGRNADGLCGLRAQKAVLGRQPHGGQKHRDHEHAPGEGAECGTPTQRKLWGKRWMAEMAYLGFPPKPFAAQAQWEQLLELTAIDLSPDCSEGCYFLESKKSSYQKHYSTIRWNTICKRTDSMQHNKNEVWEETLCTWNS